MMMKVKWIVVLLAVVHLSSALRHDEIKEVDFHPLSYEMIDHINNYIQPKWKVNSLFISSAVCSSKSTRKVME